MIWDFEDYRSYLKNVLAEKKIKNSSFSMRAFAQTLGLSQPGLSQVLAGKKNLSLEKSMQMGQRLQLKPKEADYFHLLVQFAAAKDSAVRESLLARLNQLRPTRPIQELSLDFFRTISDWYHLVIRNMTEIPEYQLTPKNISSRLGITRIEAEAAIDRLCRLELIVKDPREPGRYKKTENYVIAKAAAPNEALRNFHRQMLEKAILSLAGQSPQEKIVGSETFAMYEGHLSEARDITEEYFQKMASLADRPEKKTQVYHLGVQFFNVTKEGKS